MKPEEKSPRRKALGRGLNALLTSTRPAASAAEAEISSQDRIRRIPLHQIDPSPDQPRQIFRDEGIEELAQSIRVDGLIQPIVVQPNGDRFQLIVGERRWRAAKIAGIHEIPCIVQEFERDRALEIALVENIQREDLNPIEVAQAFDRLCREMGMSHEEIAKRTGKDRSTVTNMIRLLRLPDQVQILLAERKLSMGHARAILGIENPQLQLSLADKAAAEGLSVRQVERAVQKMNEERDPAEPKPETKLDPNVKAALEELERHLGTRVKIAEKGQGRGKIEIEFYSMEDLDRIYSLIVGESEG